VLLSLTVGKNLAERSVADVKITTTMLFRKLSYVIEREGGSVRGPHKKALDFAPLFGSQV
jgi:hypothetical protein